MCAEAAQDEQAKTRILIAMMYYRRQESMGSNQLSPRAKDPKTMWATQNDANRSQDDC